MNLIEKVKGNLYERAMDIAISVDEDGIRQEIERTRNDYPDKDDQWIAKRIAERYMVYAFFEGAATSTAAGPWLAFPATILDSSLMVHFIARINASAGILTNPDYLRTHDHAAEAQTILADRVPTIQAAKHGAMGTVRKIGTRLAPKLGRKTIGRAIPLVGAVVGGAWNLVEVSKASRRVMALHFGRAE